MRAFLVVHIELAMKIYPIITLTFLLFSLTACGSAKEQLGLGRKSPDEFAVFKRAPLEMPPDYSLRPPKPGTMRPQETATDEQARAVVFGEEASGRQKNVESLSGEKNLLQKAGSDYANPEIREIVDQETARLRGRDQPVAQKLLGIGGSDPSSKEVLDAREEAERLKEISQEEEPSAIDDNQDTEINQDIAE